MYACMWQARDQTAAAGQSQDGVMMYLANMPSRATAGLTGTSNYIHSMQRLIPNDAALHICLHQQLARSAGRTEPDLGVELVRGQALQEQAGSLVQMLRIAELMLRHGMLHKFVHNDGHGQEGV